MGLFDKPPAKPTKGRVQVRTVEKDGKKVLSDRVRDQAVEGSELPPDTEYIGYVTYRVGSTVAVEGTYSSTTCHVEVTLPVALPAPVSGDKTQKIRGGNAVRRALKAATNLADEHFEREAELLQKG